MAIAKLLASAALVLSLLAPSRCPNTLALSFSSDGKQLATAGLGLPIKIWDVATGKELRRVSERSAWASPALFTPDGKLIAHGGKSDRVQRIPLDGRGEAEGLRLASAMTPWATLSRDGKILAGPGRGSEDQEEVSIVDLDSLKKTHGLKTPATVWSCAFMPDGKTVLAAVDDRSLRGWDLASGKESLKIATPQSCFAIAVSPDGKTVAAGADDGSVTLWDPQGKVLLTMKHDGFILGVAFSPDGKKLASASFSGSTKVWDVSSGKLLHSMSGGYGSVTFSPDGRILAAGGTQDAPRVWLWDAENGKELRTLNAR